MMCTCINKFCCKIVQIMNEDYRIININTYGTYAYNILCEVSV